MRNNRSFFYDQVSAEFKGHTTYGDLYQIDRVAQEIRAATGRPNDDFAEGYAEAYLLTTGMTFNWRDDVPEEYRTLETWWGMVKAKEPVHKTFLYLVENVPAQIVTAWRNAVIESLRSWKPGPEKMIEDEGSADPKP